MSSAYHVASMVHSVLVVFLVKHTCLDILQCHKKHHSNYTTNIINNIIGGGQKSKNYNDHDIHV